MNNHKLPVPKSVSAYMSALANRANLKMRGTEMAKARSAKAVAARKKKAEERKAEQAAANKS